MFDIAGPSIKDKNSIRDKHLFLGSIPMPGIMFLLLCYIPLELVKLAFIYPDTCPRVFLKSFCRPYTNGTYGFD